ncbi:MAG: subclass B3 metallo-beta-lactamase [Vicinamibacteria bacterium]|nr:subclass B3 metallo-beta-lactamase [Vicinamibacteria bacterium]
MIRRALAFLSVMAAVAAVPAARQFDTSSWNLPFAPFTVAGPVHYVGTSELGAYLITTPEGHVLIDGGLPESAPLIERSIRQIGFKVDDVEVLLTTQAHFDHVGSLAALQTASGGKVMVMEGDAAVVETGGKGDYLFGDRMPFPAVKVDRVLRDGDTVTLGGITLRAVLTPGHTKGCTTWTTEITEGGPTLTVLFAGSTGVNPGTVLPSMPTYPTIGADYDRAFRVQAALSPDIWLAAHASLFGLADKREKQKAGGPNPFIDPDGWKRSVENRRKAHAELPRR